jgi:hypothetical protein
MTKTFAMLLALGAVLLMPVSSALAQETATAETVSLTGCLTAEGADDTATYSLTDEASGETAALQGEGLADHAGHKVTVTGTWSEEGSAGKHLMVESVEHIAETCGS